jgi:hypothetical protein
MVQVVDQVLEIGDLPSNVEGSDVEAIPVMTTTTLPE